MRPIPHSSIVIQLFQVVDTSQNETNRKRETEANHFNLRTSFAFFTTTIRCKLCTEILLSSFISQLILFDAFPFRNNEQNYLELTRANMP